MKIWQTYFKGIRSTFWSVFLSGASKRQSESSAVQKSTWASSRRDNVATTNGYKNLLSRKRALTEHQRLTLCQAQPLFQNLNRAGAKQESAIWHNCKKDENIFNLDLGGRLVSTCHLKESFQEFRLM